MTADRSLVVEDSSVGWVTPVRGEVRPGNGSFVDLMTANAHTTLRIASTVFEERIERASMVRLR